MKQLLAGSRVAVLAGVALLLIGVAQHLTAWPLLTSTLGPTAYVFFAHPNEERSSLRNASIGHAVAVGGGLVGLGLTGSWYITNQPIYDPSSLPHVLASVIAVVITLLTLSILRTHHPPAASTAVIVGSGLGQPGLLLEGLVIGLAALFVLQLALNQIPGPSGG